MSERDPILEEVMAILVPGKSKEQMQKEFEELIDRLTLESGKVKES